MIPIPYGMRYRATMGGRSPKLVKCALCNMEYVYLLERQATAEGSSLLFLDNEGASSRASSRAAEALHTRLAREVDVVPCPGCGHIQPDMVREARRLRLRGLKFAGLVFLPIAALLWMVTMTVSQARTPLEASTIGLLWCVTALAALCVPGLPLLKYFLCRSYDPNGGDVEAKKRVGQGRAVSKDEFLRAIQEKNA